MALQTVLQTVLDLILPPACAACGRAGAGVCRACVASFTPPKLGEFVTVDAGVALGDALTLGVGAFAFDGALRRALGRLKYAGAARTSEPLAAVASPAFRRLLAIAGPGACLVPVPLHAKRRRERGYNQAELLARALGRTTGVSVTDVLERREATERQHSLDRAARLRNLRGAIRVTGEPPSRACRSSSTTSSPRRRPWRHVRRCCATRARRSSTASPSRGRCDIRRQWWDGRSCP